jgi:hypothetical protein
MRNCWNSSFRARSVFVALKYVSNVYIKTMFELMLALAFPPPTCGAGSLVLPRPCRVFATKHLVENKIMRNNRVSPMALYSFSFNTLGCFTSPTLTFPHSSSYPSSTSGNGPKGVIANGFISP